MDMMVLLESRGLLVLLVDLVYQDYLGLKDHQEQEAWKEIQVSLDLQEVQDWEEKEALLEHQELKAWKVKKEHLYLWVTFFYLGIHLLIISTYCIPKSVIFYIQLLRAQEEQMVFLEDLQFQV